MTWLLLTCPGSYNSAMLPMPDTICVVAGARRATQQRQQRQWCRQRQEQPLAKFLVTVLGAPLLAGIRVVWGLVLRRTMFAG